MLWRLFNTVEDSISTVEGIQYSGGRIKDIDIFSNMIRNFHSEVFSKIQADFMLSESWTGVLQVQPCFEIIDNFIFGMLYLPFKFNCLCDCT